MLHGLLDRLAAKYGRDSLDARRPRACGSTCWSRRAEYPDPRQQPTFLYVPGCRATPYFDRSLFPWIEEFEALHGRDPRQNCWVSCASDDGRERVFTVRRSRAAEPARRAGPADLERLLLLSARRTSRRQLQPLSPQTAAAIDRAAAVASCPGTAPRCCISVFKPGTHLLPHQGVTNTRVVGHLPLIVPRALRVATSAANCTSGRKGVSSCSTTRTNTRRGIAASTTRVVLIFDLWNPYLTEAERAAVTDIVVEISEFRHATEQA